METLNEGLAMTAFHNISHDPDGRGRRTIQEHKDTLAADYEALKAHAGTPEKLAILDEAFAWYRDGYTKRTNDWLGATSRCISSFICGPSNFPVDRARKFSEREHKASVECTSFRKWALEKIYRKLHPELAPIMASDENAAERLEEKLRALKESQETMKLANKALRANAKKGPEAQKAALIALGLAEDQATKILKPDCFGTKGFAGYKLTNNNANIKRVEQRLAQVKRNQATETTEAQGTLAKLVDCPAENRVRLFFPGKPEEGIRTELKRGGFRWSPTIGAWQAYRNQVSMDRAKKFAGVL